MILVQRQAWEECDWTPTEHPGIETGLREIPFPEHLDVPIVSRDPASGLMVYCWGVDFYLGRVLIPSRTRDGHFRADFATGNLLARWERWQDIRKVNDGC